MAKAGDQYEFRTGNLWSVCRRDDLSTARLTAASAGKVRLSQKRRIFRQVSLLVSA